MTKHFKPEVDKKIRCTCCLQGGIDSETYAVLELVRHHFKAPVTINSGYRCEKYNKRVGGAANSQHTIGTAVDIVVKGYTPKEVYDFLDEVFPDTYGLGLYDDFTHVDVRSKRARW